MSPLCVAPFCPVLSFVAPCCLHLTLCVSRVRGAGTAAINLSLVASGCVEAYYEMGMHVWDIAAGSLLVLEAGGVVMDVDGEDAAARPLLLLSSPHPPFSVQVETWT